MKFFLVFTSLLLIATGEKACRKKKAAAAAPVCLKGRLVVKGGCMNYTISITGGAYDTALVVPTWTDEATGKTYRNAFALGSRCNFPTTINEGDEFYFDIDNASLQDCAVCMMYYPVPSKKLSIRVVPACQ